MYGSQQIRRTHALWLPTRTSINESLIDMNNRLLLVKGITLLYRESQLSGNNENSAELVREIISSVKLPEVNVGIDRERDILEGLKETALFMCDTPADHRHDPSDLLERLRVITGEDTGLYETFKDSIEDEMDEAKLKRRCLDARRALRNHLSESKVGKFLGDASYKWKFEREKIPDVKKFVAQIVSELEPYQVDNDTKDPAVIGAVSLSNIDQVKGVYEQIAQQAEGKGILKTGFQGMNRLLDGGFRRGEEWVMGALQHNYKTGLSLTLYRQIAMYNEPVLTVPTKRPLLLRISFEDSLLLNFQSLYSQLWQNEYGEIPNLMGLSVDHLAEYTQRKMNVMGYETHLLHVNPSLWSYRDICNYVLKLEAEGNEIHMCMVDYLLKVPTVGCDQGPHGHDIRNMYERIRNFMESKGITFITPHQLSTDAKMLKRAGQTELVKQMVGGGFYAGSKQIDQVVDGEIFQHIETVNNESFLTIQRGKHRKIAQTPLEHQYIVLPFTKGGCILDDINGPDSTRKKVGGGPIGSKDETPFWEFEGMPA